MIVAALGFVAGGLVVGSAALAWVLKNVRPWV